MNNGQRERRPLTCLPLEISKTHLQLAKKIDKSN